jgi:hypothetical protein
MLLLRPMHGVGGAKVPMVLVNLSPGNFTGRKLYFRVSSWTYLQQLVVDFPRVSIVCGLFVDQQRL